jgi:predicted glycosyltransferase
MGHLVRSLRIAAGLERKDFVVDLVMGGVPVKGMETAGVHVTQLPPLKAGPGGFSDLRDQDGQPVGEDYKSQRRDKLLTLLDKRTPEVVMIEAFPFGRRQMRFELIALLEAAKKRQPRPLIICSVRDILQENKAPNRLDETVACLKTYFDLVLVHGDPDFVDLASTFPRVDEISDLIKYTGIVAGPAPAVVKMENVYKVVVSTGGGATGENILKCALEARAKTRFANDRWCVITGPYLSQNVKDDLAAMATSGLEVHEYRNDLANLMANARVSVSRGGYNTVVDIFQTGVPSVIIPNANDGETEQTRRAQLLADRQLAVMIDETGLNPDRMAEAIDHAADMPVPANVPNLNGVETTALIVSEALSMIN